MNDGDNLAQLAAPLTSSKNLALLGHHGTHLESGNRARLLMFLMLLCDAHRD